MATAVGPALTYSSAPGWWVLAITVLGSGVATLDATGFRTAVLISGGLCVAGGLLAAATITKPRRAPRPAGEPRPANACMAGSMRRR